MSEHEHSHDQRKRLDEKGKKKESSLFDLDLEHEDHPRNWRHNPMFARQHDPRHSHAVEPHQRESASRQSDEHAAPDAAPQQQHRRSTGRIAETSERHISQQHRSERRTPPRNIRPDTEPEREYTSDMPYRKGGLFDPGQNAEFDNEYRRFEAGGVDEYEHTGRLFAHRYDPSDGIGQRATIFQPPREISIPRPAFLILVAVISLVLIQVFWPGSNPTTLSNWGGFATGTREVVGGAVEVLTGSNPFEQQPNPPGNYNLRAPPSLSAGQIDDILASYGSPADGTGEAWVRYGREYDIDPAFAVAFFIHESTAGTAPGWAGLKPDGSTTHNVGNIICAGYDTCYGRFRDYGSWEEGIADWYRLISVEYIEGRGTETVAEIIPIYAPAFENDVDLYVRTVEQMVDSWRGTTEPGDLGDDAPFGNPLGSDNTVMTQGYGTGSHAPAVTWGAVDLALDGDGDGRADPEGTRGQPIYATHGGVVDVTRNSWPAGNHIWVMNDQYRTGYAHLLSFAVSDGERVERGSLIGYIGSTGQSSGPHLDYQVWHKENGAWVNVNPLGFGVLNN